VLSRQAGYWIGEQPEQSAGDAAAEAGEGKQQLWWRPFAAKARDAHEQAGCEAGEGEQEGEVAGGIVQAQVQQTAS
jgi:hypothetical protein